MKEHDIDKKVEKLLTALGKELSNRRKAYADTLLDDNVPDSPFIMPSKSNDSRWNE